MEWKEQAITCDKRISDSDCGRYPQIRCSVSGTRVYVNDSVTQWSSATQKHLTLLVTEAEQAGAVVCAQDMIFQRHILISIGFEVELPMILEVDNQGCVDLANNQTADGRTRHVDVRRNWLRVLKEKGILVVK